jgi:hypothetical protein
VTTSLDESQHVHRKTPGRPELFLMLVVFLGLLIGITTMVMITLSPQT